MNNSSKEQIGCDVICRNHSARTERDLYRICPSKLSKRELEDLYFSLLENNLDLKKTVNVLQDKIKVLSTRLQRMTVSQKNVAGKEKDCCASKAIINQQRESIIDLKKTNERMAERIRLLNMRLCSAKQFLKRSPSQANTNSKTCTRCSFKNSSMSALTAKPSETIGTAAVSFQYLDKAISARTIQTAEAETEKQEKEDSEKTCNENKCRTTMEELKEKIINLQEELVSSHTEYSQRIAKLESQVLGLQDENVRVRSDHATSEHALEQRRKKADLLQDQLRTADAKCNELNMELTIEKKKVAELETGLKLADIPNHTMKTIKQLAAAKDENRQSLSEQPTCSHCSRKTSSKDNLEVPTSSPKTKDEVMFSTSDDSGYTDLNKSCETDDNQTMVKINQDLLKKIAELKTELDVLRIASAGVATVSAPKNKSNDFESDVETKYGDETQLVSAEDSGSVVMEMMKTLVKKTNAKITENKEFDSDDAKASAIEPGPSKPWDDFMVCGGARNKQKDTINDMEQRSASSTTIVEKSDLEGTRDDDHNRYQIPGPIPLESTPIGVLPSNFNRKHYKNGTEPHKTKKAISEEKTVKICESKDSVLISDKQGNIEPIKAIHPIINLKESRDADDVEHKNKQIEWKMKSVSITDVVSAAKLADRSRDSLLVNRKKLTPLEEAEPPELDRINDTMSEVKKESNPSLLDMGSSYTPPNTSHVNNNALEQGTQSNDTIDQYEICESHAVVCRCPLLERKDVAVFRSCSGTLRFRTTSTSEKLRRCGCRLQTESSGSQMDPGPARRDSTTYTADLPHTYTVDKRERATSPENTEHEISSLTDLPSENVKSPRCLSPGEEKGTMTYTDTEQAQSDYKSLSEGEMPISGSGRRLSAGERLPITTNTPVPSVTSSDKMEATLQSISEELARCRQLLMTQRSQEKEGRGPRAASAAKEELEVFALHPSAANRRITDAHTPTCIFTLHIGTMVLSDEAVIYSQNKSMVLLWQFFTQRATMASVNPGRVALFDFITEYNLTFSSEFLCYMIQADMIIVLCELDKQNKPFATCSLPLREVLLHANRQADFSLALVPNIIRSSSQSLGDEVGVLDLWCSLKVDAAQLPLIHNAIHTASLPKWPGVNPLRSDTKMHSQAGEDDLSSEYISPILAAPNRAPETLWKRLRASDVKSLRRPSDENGPNMVKEASSRYDDDVEQYRPSRPNRRRSSQAQKSIPNSELGHKGHIGFEKTWTSPTGTVLRQESSGIIVNEVPTKIKSSNEMKQALERNVQQNIMTKLPKMDDKNLAAKHQLSKLRWPKNKLRKEPIDSLQEIMKKDKGSTGGSTTVPPVKLVESYVKDDRNINMLSCSIPEISKLVEASKKSVKYTDRPPNENEGSADSSVTSKESIDISILWLALNEECEAMVNPDIQRLYIAFSFLGLRGADLETPFSLPKPKHYADKCYFNFKKKFNLHECDLPLLGHMSRCRAGGGASTDPRDCIVFTLVSEPPEDPLGISSCEDIGYAYLYLGDVLAYSGGSGGYTEVVGVRGARGGVCGVLAVRVDNLHVLRRALSLSHSHSQSYRDLQAVAAPQHSVPTFEIE